MIQKPKSHRKWPGLENFGILLAGVGLCSAFAFIHVGFSEEQLEKEKQQVDTRMNHMKSALSAAEVPPGQIPGLLRIHKAAVVSAVTQVQFVLVSFCVLLSLMVASVGFTMVLGSKLRAFTQTERKRIDVPVAG